MNLITLGDSYSTYHVLFHLQFVAIFCELFDHLLNTLDVHLLISFLHNAVGALHSIHNSVGHLESTQLHLDRRKLGFHSIHLLILLPDHNDLLRHHLGGALEENKYVCHINDVGLTYVLVFGSELLDLSQGLFLLSFQISLFFFDLTDGFVDDPLLCSSLFFG